MRQASTPQRAKAPANHFAPGTLARGVSDLLDNDGGNSLQKFALAAHVVVHGHWRDAEVFRESTNAEMFRAVAIEQRQRFCEYSTSAQRVSGRRRSSSVPIGMSPDLTRSTGPA